VGITTATTTGAAGGLFGMNQLCKNEYPGAKVCRADEVIEVNRALITETVWLLSLADIKIFGGDEVHEIRRAYFNGFIDAASDGNDCYGWTLTSGSHWRLETTGRIKNRIRCNISQPGACCK